jgi:hypothetical protein
MFVLAQANEGTDFGSAVEEFVQTLGRVLPQALLFLLILIVGYFIAKAVSRILDRVLERVGFDRAVERGGVGKALERSKFDASDILGKVVFYGLMLFVLQLAFGVFGDNPISDLIQGVIAYLPNLFAAVVIIVIAAAIAAAVKELLEAVLGALSYGRTLASAASIAILFIGGFAALDQLRIAPDIVDTLFTAIVYGIVAIAVIAIGGSGVLALRPLWDRALAGLQGTGSEVRDQAQGGTERIRERAEQRVDQARQAAPSSGESTTGASSTRRYSS